MAELDTIRKELETLLKEVKSLQAEASRPTAEMAGAAAEPTPEAAETDEAADALGELQAYLATKAGEAEEALEDHPIVTLAAAFVLGLVAGAIAFR